MKNKSKEQNNIWYISKKTEKLASAVYILTDFLSDTEPIKVHLRTYALMLLGRIHALENALLSEKKKAGRRFADGTDSLSSYLEVAAGAGMVSRMNADVLIREFSSLSSIIRDSIYRAEHEEGFSSEDFLPASSPESPRQEDSFSLQNADGRRPDMSSTRTMSTDHVRPAGGPSDMLPIGGSVKSEERFSRRTQILNIIKENKQVMIKDIFGRLRGVGEKTIQRELGALINAGLIRKTGERRWSRYSIR